MSDQLPINLVKLKDWQTEAFDSFARHRFLVCNCGRRSGKSFFASYAAALSSLSQPGFEVAYIASSIKQARNIIWRGLRELCTGLPGIQFKEASSIIEFENGSRVTLLAGDGIESARGSKFHLAVCDELAMWQRPREAWEEVLRPCLADTEGQALFVSTPKSRDLFHELYQKGLDPDEPDWASIRVSSFDAGTLTEREQKRIIHDAPPNVLKREYLADFDVEAADQLIPSQLVTEASSPRNYFKVRESDVRIMGVDPSRFGDDRTVIQRRVGLTLLEPIVIADKIRLTELARRIEVHQRKFAADGIFVDSTGLGAGLADNLDAMGLPVFEVNFADASPDKGCINMRSYIYWQLKLAFDTGRMYLPSNQPELVNELLNIRYTLNEKGQVQIESKADIKKRGHRSPDLADAAAVCWAYNIIPDRMPLTPQSAMAERRHQEAMLDYDPFQDY